MAACFPRVPCMQRSQGNWRPLDSECLILRYHKDSGTKIMAFQCEGRRYEDRGSAQICLLTVDSHSNSKCKACKVCVQCQSSISCGAEVLTARHLICASGRFFFLSNLHCQFVKPHGFAVSRTDLLSFLEPNQRCYPECHLGKGARKGTFFPQCLLAQRTRFWTVNKREFQLWERGCRLRSFWWRQLAEKTAVPNRIPKSHC